MKLPRQRRKDNRRKQFGPAKSVNGFRFRAWAACAFLVFGFGVIGVRLLSLGFIPYGEPETTPRLTTYTPFEQRGNIVDRNGELMATTLSVYSLFADPANVLDSEQVARQLPTVLTDLTTQDVRNKLSRNSRFVWLKRALTPHEVYQVNALGLPGLGFRKEDRRMYPQQNVAAHVIGATNYQGQGISGIEGGAEEKLASGEDVALTIDMRLQRALHDALERTMEAHGAKGAWGITLDANTAEVVAMVSLPDYDANAYGKAPRSSWLNRNLGGVYEMGSTFKTFTLAMAKQELGMSLEEEIDCTKPLRIGRFTIRDSHAKRKWLKAREVFAYSSNIGAAQIADRMGPEVQQNYFQKLGLLDSVDIGMVTSVTPLYPEHHRWKRIATMSMSYGHGIAVTPIQMVSAMRAVAVDGVLKQPYTMMGQERLPDQQVFKASTVAAVRDLLGDVTEYGTGSHARVHGYKVGGKTGTSEKSVAGGYDDKKHVASFVGVMPLDNPRFVTLIMVDEADEGAAGGGVAAAPAFADFAKQAVAILGIAPTEKTVELLKPEAQNGVLQAAAKAKARAKIQAQAAPKKATRKAQKHDKHEIITAYYHPTYQ